MPTFNGFLMRDSLSDTGVVPSPGYPYHSPDLIGHAQVNDAKSFFTANYDSDPNQPLDRGSATNYFYVRAKNLSSATLSGYYITVYRANASLFMNTSVWRNNPLSTQSGVKYVTLDSTASGQVAVGNAPFLLDAIHDKNFCLIGMATPTATPDIPPPFSTYSDYISWVRNNQNICGRNLNLVQNYPDRSYEQLDEFSNPESIAVPTLFQVNIHGTLPTGTTFGLNSAPLGLSTTWNISDGPVQTASAMTPAQFQGNVTTWATLPSGSWPEGVWIETIVYVGVGANTEAASYARRDWSFLAAAPEVLDVNRPHLVQLGTCSSRFIS